MYKPSRWALRLLADELVELSVVESISYETVRRVLKKTNLSHTCERAGQYRRSTILVPGYIDEKEVASIALFIAGLNPDIPYALLGFHGDFLTRDLPTTPLKQAEACLEAAKKGRLKTCVIGQLHLLH